MIRNEFESEIIIFDTVKFWSKCQKIADANWYFFIENNSNFNQERIFE
jgi:hypothetical protein